MVDLASRPHENAAIRLGMVGVAFADSDGTVTQTHGELSDWLLVGQRIADSSSALLGMEEAMEELRQHPGQRLNLPNICLDQTNQQNFHTINVQWDPADNQFVITTTTIEAAKGSEFDNLRKLRSQRYFQDRIAEERQHFRTIYEQSPHLAVSYNNKAKLLAASNDIRKQFLGEQVEDSPLHKQLTEGPIWQAMWNGERLHAHSLKTTGADGEMRQLELSGYLVTPPDMLSQEVYYSLTDVTERNQYRLHMQERSAELESASKQLRESNTRLSQFAAIAAHDLLSPLRRIATFTQILSEEFTGPRSESLSFALRAIQHSAERGQLLVDDVMHLTQTANSASRLEILNPTDLLKEIARDSDVLLDQIEGRIDYVGKSHTIVADAKLLRTVYRNLLSNAIKFRHEDRPLHIVHTVTDTGTGCARIEFQDNGIGFEQANANKIFEPFTRLVGDDQPSGTGLGLAIVFEALKSMNCQVTANSQLDEGTTIAVIAQMARKN